MKNLTYDQLIELAPQDRPFEVMFNLPKVEYRVWAIIDYNKDYPLSINTFRGSAYDDVFNSTYKGTFTLIDPRYQKPEVLKVGQKVMIMESVRECEDYMAIDVKFIGKEGVVKLCIDSSIGLYYLVDLPETSFNLPHYCVMPVEEKEVQEIPELDNTLEQLDNLVSKAQDIISKYKK